MENNDLYKFVSSNLNIISSIHRIFILLICASVFGFGGYFLGRQSVVMQSENIQMNENQPAVTMEPVGNALESTTLSPSATSKPGRKLGYKLESGWKTIQDAKGRLEVGYDSNRYEATARDNQVDLSGRWVGTGGTDIRRLGWNKHFYLSSYGGGSRHSEIYRILGVTANSKDWKYEKYYSEREYSFQGWNCLAINGVDISQLPSAWAFCPISGKEAVVMAFDGYDWSEIEQQMAAVRLVK